MGEYNPHRKYLIRRKRSQCFQNISVSIFVLKTNIFEILKGSLCAFSNVKMNNTVLFRFPSNQYSIFFTSSLFCLYCLILKTYVPGPRFLFLTEKYETVSHAKREGGPLGCHASLNLSSWCLHKKRMILARSALPLLQMIEIQNVALWMFLTLS